MPTLQPFLVRPSRADATLVRSGVTLHHRVGGVTSRWRGPRTDGDRRLCRVKRSRETKRVGTTGRSCLVTARVSAIGSSWGAGRA